MLKETHLRYDGESFADEGERADSLFESRLNGEFADGGSAVLSCVSAGCMLPCLRLYSRELLPATKAGSSTESVKIGVAKGRKALNL